MCLGIPGQIVEVASATSGADAGLATVDVAGVRRSIDVGLLADDPVIVGEWVLVHVGFALSKIDEAEAALELARLRDLGPAYDDEVAAIVESTRE